MQQGRYVQVAMLAGVLALAVTAVKPAHAGIVNLALDNAQDIGDVHKRPGSTSVQTGVTGSPADAVWTLNGTGDDIWGNADSFHFAYTTLTGDGGITARILSQTGGDASWAKTGTMLRETLDPGSLDAYMPYTSGNKFEASWRTKAKTTPVDNGLGNVGRTLAGGPIWIRTQRKGQTYQHLLSNDGHNWQLMGSQDLNIDPTKPVLAGLCATSHDAKKTVTATFDNVTVTPDVIQGNLVGAPTNIMAEPGNGVVLLTFSTVPNGTGYNVYRREVGQTKDQAVLVSKTPTPNGWYIDNTVANGKQYLYFLTSVVPDVTNPKKAVSEGFSTSSDALVAPNVPIPSNVAGSPGYQVYYWSTTNPATVDLTTTPGMLTVKASGGDIWGANATDSGTFIATPVPGDYSFSAEIMAQPTNSVAKNKQAKAGIMIRDGVGPSDRNAFLFSSCGRDPGVLFEGKTVDGTGVKLSGPPQLYSDAGTKLADTKFPLWLKLTKAGSLITAGQSNDGTNYTPIGKGHDYGFLSPVTFAGLAFCGQTDGAYTTATFNAASVKIQ